MHTHRHPRGIAAAILAVMATLILAVGSASAHTQTVDPKGTEAVRTNEPVSRPWAAAHCNAASPGIVYDASNGVVAFNPPSVLC